MWKPCVRISRSGKLKTILKVVALYLSDGQNKNVNSRLEKIKPENVIAVGLTECLTKFDIYELIYYYAHHMLI